MRQLSPIHWAKSKNRFSVVSSFATLNSALLSANTRYAYLPDIGRPIGPDRMTWFSALFTMCQFGSQVTFLLIGLGVRIGFELAEVPAAQFSQAFCVAWLILTFVPGWRKFTPVPALRPRPDGRSLARLGFAQNWKTVIGINKHYGSGLRWYFLAVVFAEAGANAFTVVAVTFMVEVLGMDGEVFRRRMLRISITDRWPHRI